MHSKLFEVFGLPIYSYGVMMVVGFAVGIWRARRVSKKRYGIEPERVIDIALVVLVSSVIGARTVYVWMDPYETWGHFFAVWDGGLSFHGGVVAALAAGYVYTRIAKLPFWSCVDLVVPSAAIGYALTRIGCFLRGCCYGGPTDLPWAVPTNHEGLLINAHPTQIYALLAGLLIFFILTRLERMNRAPGFVFASYLGLYGVYRFLIEILRKGYTAEVWVYGLTHAQVVSIVMVLISAVALHFLYRMPARDD